MAASAGASGSRYGQLGMETPGKWQSPGQRHLLEHRPMIPSSRLASSTLPAHPHNATDSDGSADSEDEESTPSPSFRASKSVNTRVIKPHGFTSRPKTRITEPVAPHRPTTAAASVIPTNQYGYGWSGSKRRRLELGSRVVKDARVPLDQANHGSGHGVGAQWVCGATRCEDEQESGAEQKRHNERSGKGKGMEIAQGREGSDLGGATSSGALKQAQAVLNKHRSRPSPSEQTVSPKQTISRPGHAGHDNLKEAERFTPRPPLAQNPAARPPTRPQPIPRLERTLAGPSANQPTPSQRLSESPEPLEPLRLTPAPAPAKPSVRAAMIAARKRSLSIRMSGAPDSFGKSSREELSGSTAGSPITPSGQRHPYLSRKARRLPLKPGGRASTGAAAAAATAEVERAHMPIADADSANMPALHVGGTSDSTAAVSRSIVRKTPEARSQATGHRADGLPFKPADRDRKHLAIDTQQSPASTSSGMSSSNVARPQSSTLRPATDHSVGIAYRKTSTTRSGPTNERSGFHWTPQATPSPRDSSPDPISLDIDTAGVPDAPALATISPYRAHQPHSKQRTATDARSVRVPAEGLDTRPRREVAASNDAPTRSQVPAVPRPHIESKLTSRSRLVPAGAAIEKDARTATATVYGQQHIENSSQASPQATLSTHVDKPSPRVAPESAPQHTLIKNLADTPGDSLRHSLTGLPSDNTRQSGSNSAESSIVSENERATPDARHYEQGSQRSTVRFKGVAGSSSAPHQAVAAKCVRSNARPSPSTILVGSSDDEQLNASDGESVEYDNQRSQAGRADISRIDAGGRRSRSTSRLDANASRSSIDKPRVIRVPDSDIEADDIVIVSDAHSASDQWHRNHLATTGASTRAIDRTRTSLTAQDSEIYDLTMDSDEEEHVPRPAQPLSRQRRLGPSCSAPGQLPSPINSAARTAAGTASNANDAQLLAVIRPLSVSPDSRGGSGGSAQATSRSRLVNIGRTRRVELDLNENTALLPAEKQVALYDGVEISNASSSPKRNDVSSHGVEITDAVLAIAEPPFASEDDSVHDAELPPEVNILLEGVTGAGLRCEEDGEVHNVPTARRGQSPVFRRENGTGDIREEWRVGDTSSAGSKCTPEAPFPSKPQAVVMVRGEPASDAGDGSSKDLLDQAMSLQNFASELQNAATGLIIAQPNESPEEQQVSVALQWEQQVDLHIASPTLAHSETTAVQQRGQIRSASAASESLPLAVDPVPYVDPIIRRGMAQLNMNGRANGALTSWSTRTVPGSVGDLQAELDKIWDGGEQRAIMLWHEEEIWKQYGCAKEMRLFQACWDRMLRFERFPSRSAPQADKQKHLASFLDRFGSFMRQHGLLKPFTSHLEWMGKQNWVSRTTLELLVKEWDTPGTVAEKHRKDASAARKRSRTLLGTRGGKTTKRVVRKG